MKKTIVFLSFSLILFSCVTTESHQSADIEITGSYELDLIPATTEYDVLLYLPQLPVGISAIQQRHGDGGKEISIISSSKNPYTITNLTVFNLLEAVKSDNTTYSYYGTEYTVLKTSLEKLNPLTEDGEITIGEILNMFSEKEDMTYNEVGNPTPPDLDQFSVLRQVYVYNITINDSQKEEEYLLQLCTENFVDADKLKFN